MDSFLGRWMPLDASAHGAELDRINALVHWLMLILFVGWSIYFLYVLFRFSAGRNPEASYAGAQTHLSNYVEGGVAVVEVLLLVGFGVPLWAQWITPPSSDDDPVTVRVVAEQFAWNMHYPGADGIFGRTAAELVSTSNPLGLDNTDSAAADDITTVNQLHLPVDRPATLLLSSKDVIHSFGLPVMRVKQDAIPGAEIPVHFTPVQVTPDDARLPACAGSKSCWEIACAQLCGLGHFRMRGFMTIHTQDEFDAWLAGQSAASGAA